MQLFHLVRDEDMTGVSGVGIVAEGVIFRDGRVAMRWLSQYRSTSCYDSIADVEAIHCHHGLSRIVLLSQSQEAHP